MWNMSGKKSSSGQEEGKLQDTVSLVEEPSTCLADTDSGGFGFTETEVEKTVSTTVFRPGPKRLLDLKQRAVQSTVILVHHQLETPVSEISLDSQGLTQLVEPEADGGVLRSQAVGLGDGQGVERLPERGVPDVAMLVDGVHDARPPRTFTPATTTVELLRELPAGP